MHAAASKDVRRIDARFITAGMNGHNHSRSW